MKFYLLAKKFDGAAEVEYRFTKERITDTERDNNLRHGWRIVQSWAQKPTMTKVQEAVQYDGWALEETAAEKAAWRKINAEGRA
jgi:hypothetical protein